MPLFLEYDALFSTLVFATLMVVGWSLGARSLRLQSGRHELNRFDDGALALFGLLLAFCFSGAAGRYEARKHLVLEEASAIGDLAGTSALLTEPVRGQLLSELKGYVGLRLAVATVSFSDVAFAPLEQRTQAAQGRIAALVAQAIRELNTATAHTALIHDLNALTTAHDKRVQGLRDHIPESVVIRLVVFGVFSTFTMARAEGTRGFSALAYVVLVAIVFWVTLDLEIPRRGWMRVSQQPLQDLAARL